jgi:PTS system N-acetylglucosamine-specific IIC component
VIDGSKVDEVAARHAGANGVIRLNNQSVQIIIGPKAELVAAAMQKLLGK